MDIEYLRLRLAASNQEPLLGILLSLCGLILIERYLLKSIFAVGGQSILYEVEDLSMLNEVYLLRMGRLPFHRPAYITKKDILRVRNRITHEAEILSQFKGSCLPVIHDFFYAPNPLHTIERSQNLNESEPYIVMELIHGVPPDKITFETASKKTGLLLNIIKEVIDLFKLLHQKGYLYTDIKPENLLIQNSLVRVLDAGSIIPCDYNENIDIPFTWSYISPRYYQEYHQGHNIWPDVQFVAYTFGKTLMEIMTGYRSVPGENPDFAHRKFQDYPQMIQDFIKSLIIDNFTDFSSMSDHVHWIINSSAENKDLSRSQHGK